MRCAEEELIAANSLLLRNTESLICKTVVTPYKQSESTPSEGHHFNLNMRLPKEASTLIDIRRKYATDISLAVKMLEAQEIPYYDNAKNRIWGGENKRT